jgi:hypothetical protein
MPLQEALLLKATDPVYQGSLALLASLEDRTQIHPKPDLPGPHDELRPSEVDALVSMCNQHGNLMLVFEEWALRYGGRPNSNLVFKMVISPRSVMPYFDWLVVVGDPADAERLLRSHVKKSEMYGVAFLGDGVLSTNDNEKWAKQRAHLQEAFFPNTTFATQVFPKSLARAQYAARELMAAQCRAGPVEMVRAIVQRRGRLTGRGGTRGGGRTSFCSTKPWRSCSWR